MTAEQLRLELKNKIVDEIGLDIKSAVIEEVKETFVLNLIELSKLYNPNQILFMLASYVDYKLVWILLNHKCFSKKDIQDLINKNVIINKPNKEYDDAVFSDEITEMLDKIMSSNINSYKSLAEEFVDVYPSKHIGEKTLFLKKITNMEMLLKQYVRNIQADAKKHNKLIEEYHKEVIEKVKQNKDNIVININSFVEGKAWNDLKLINKTRSKYDV